MVLLAILKLAEKAGCRRGAATLPAKLTKETRMFKGNTDREGRCWLPRCGEGHRRGAAFEGDVTVRVERSSLNYKDGLAITWTSPSFPA